jgi:hypothetical protein
MGVRLTQVTATGGSWWEMPEDYPRSMMELERRFRTEEACAAYSGSRRWLEGFRCPGCGQAAAWQIARGLWVSPVPPASNFGDRSNLVFSKWDQIFKDPMTTMAAVNRLVHHAIILESQRVSGGKRKGGA